ncbi:MAG TPA: serine hydrolase [Methylocystis sp.]|nr:serine hydrolase [Methylocystis sp.]
MALRVSHGRPVRAAFWGHGRHVGHAAAHQESGGRFLSPPGFAAIVVDANSGRTLFSLKEDQQRHPASITKVMTLYLLFEQLENGRMNRHSPLRISQHAAAQAPCKLNLEPGETIEVEDAIKAVVTKSANDIAVAIAESVGGDEEHFAQMMTAKAHALGMRDTHFANASGLPNPAQITTAHDLAVLGRAIQERFPKYYRYFSTHAFAYNGEVMRNHNHLLDRVEGMDGIKTGYTNASGFNLLTSVRRGGRHIVAVVLGGRTAAARDAYMASLIQRHIGAGGTQKTAQPISEEGEDGVETTEPTASIPPARLQEAARPQQESMAYARAPEDDEPTPAPERSIATQVQPASAPEAAPSKVRPAFVSGGQRRPAAEAGGQPHALGGSTTTSALGKSVARVAAAPTTPSALKAANDNKPQSIKADQSRPAHPGWMIQLGATEELEKAQELLARARSEAHALPASAKAFTEKVRKGSETLYRARFAGLGEDSAGAACRELKRSGFSCFATKN